MLRQAKLHKEELERELALASTKRRCQDFFDNDSHNMGFSDKDLNDDWGCIRMVSVKKPKDQQMGDRSLKVVGYFSARIARPERFVSSIGMIRFPDELDPTFVGDLSAFANHLFEDRGFSKISWDAIVGSSADDLYQKIVKRYGGKIVGVHERHRLDTSGCMRDVRLFELSGKDFLANRNNGLITDSDFSDFSDYDIG